MDVSEMSRMGGLKRMRGMTAQERHELAKKASAKRWALYRERKREEERALAQRARTGSGGGGGVNGTNIRRHHAPSWQEGYEAGLEAGFTAGYIVGQMTNGSGSSSSRSVIHNALWRL